MSDILLLAAIVMLVLLFLKVPVYLAVLGGSMVYFALNPHVSAAVFAQQTIIGTEKISLMAIPFFVCAGIFMNYTGVTKRIMDFCEVVTGRLPGGLAQVNVLLSTVMGGLSGSNIADAAMESKMMVPEMTKKGFSLEFSSVVTAASSMITPLIPPGIAMILYGCIANVSIGKLFMSGLGVGALLCITMMILVGVISKKRGYGNISTEKMTWSRFWKAFKPAILPLLLPIIIIGGIRIGVFTATEAGAVAIIYAAFLGLLYKEMHIKDMIQGLKETACTTTSIMLIVSAASVFSWILTKEQIPQALTAWMLANIHSKFVFLIVVNIFLLIVGMVMDTTPAILILSPILLPIVQSIGMNPIHFGVVMIVNLAIGFVTPPIGVNLFVASSLTDVPVMHIAKKAMPMIGYFLLALLLLTFIPAISLFLL